MKFNLIECIIGLVMNPTKFQFNKVIVASNPVLMKPNKNYDYL